MLSSKQLVSFSAQVWFNIFSIIVNQKIIILSNNVPVIQSSLISLGNEGYSLGYADWALDMYTAAAWISCGLALIGILLFTPCIFQEFDLGEREAEWNRIRAAGEFAKLTASHEETQNGPSHRPVVRQMRDSIGMGLCIANFFIVGFIFILIET